MLTHQLDWTVFPQTTKTQKPEPTSVDKAEDREGSAPQAKEDNLFLGTKWERRQYYSGNTLIWNVLQPEITEANEAGLHEGYLGLASQTVDNLYAAEFSFPIFENGIPQSLDEWIDDFLMPDKNTGLQLITKRSVETIDRTDNIPIKILHADVIVDGTKGPSVPMNFVFISGYTATDGRKVNPSLIVVKVPGDSVSNIADLDAFTKHLVDGLMFIQ